MLEPLHPDCENTIHDNCLCLLFVRSWNHEVIRWIKEDMERRLSWLWCDMHVLHIWTEFGDLVWEQAPDLGGGVHEEGAARSVWTTVCTLVWAFRMVWNSMSKFTQAPIDN
jgi:hypothetical protein